MDARDHIMGSSSAGYSFLLINQSVVGQIITEPKVTQQRNFHDGQPAFWPSGDAKLQTVFQIKTELRNYEGISKPDTSKPDDGIRTIFIKGKHMEKAAKEAVLTAGGDFLTVGGWIQITYTGDDMSSKAASKPKFFSIRYQPPAPGSAQPQAQHQGTPQAQSYGAQNAYGNPGAGPGWQQPGWQAQAVPQPSPGGFGTSGTHGGPPFPPQPSAGFAQPSAVPSHHGSPEQMPQWAQAAPASAVPAPSSAPPAPQLSTLELIAQAQANTSGSGQVEPAF